MLRNVLKKRRFFPESTSGTIIPIIYIMSSEILTRFATPGVAKRVLLLL
jgi:hypothetical protein